jgi:hypothetical protein
MSIFQNLPHDLIMRIIKEADGGRNSHEEKFYDCIHTIGDVGTHFQEKTKSCGWDDIYNEGIYSDQFFEVLRDQRKLVLLSHF